MQPLQTYNQLVQDGILYFDSELQNTCIIPKVSVLMYLPDDEIIEIVDSFYTDPDDGIVCVNTSDTSLNFNIDSSCFAVISLS